MTKSGSSKSIKDFNFVLQVTRIKVLMDVFQITRKEQNVFS